MGGVQRQSGHEIKHTKHKDEAVVGSLREGKIVSHETIALE
jgi:hypothetical protein